MGESTKQLASAALAAELANLPAGCPGGLRVDLTRVSDLGLDELQQLWRRHLGKSAPMRLPKWLLVRLLAYRLQAAEHGDLPRETIRMLTRIADEQEQGKDASIAPVLEQRIKPGTVLVREHGGVMHRVTVLLAGYAWNGETYPSLSAVAKAITGTRWNGYAFFGLKERNKRKQELNGRAQS
jgi:hypothetical protein